MKHALIYLDYQSQTESFLLEQLQCCGITLADIQIIIVRERGIANAINTGLRQINNEIGLITILANDIIEPINWLKKREDFCKGNIGICSFALNNEPYKYNSNIIGNFTISRDVLIKVGAMDERFDPYGAIDLDYCVRARAAGFITTYIPNETAWQNNAVANKYDFDKQTETERTWQYHAESVEQFMNGTLPYYISL